MISLIINAALFVLVFLLSFKEEKGLSVYNVVLLSYSCISILGVYICATDIYEYDLKYNSIIPYVILLFSVLLMTSPLKQGQNIEANISTFKNPIYNNFILFVFFISIIYSLLLYAFYSIIQSMSFADIYSMRSTEESIRLPNRYLNSLFFMSGKFLNTSLPFVLMILFSRMVVSGKVKYLILSILFLLPQLISFVLLSNRGALFFMLMTVVFFVLYYYKYLKKSIRKIIIVAGTVTIVLAASYSILITNSRVENKSWTNGTESILHYFGEAVPNFSQRVWPEKINHPYGLRKYSTIFSLFEDDNLSFYDSADRSEYWNWYTNAPVINFKTGVGDMYVEFGFVISLMLILLTNKIFLILLRWYRQYGVVILSICYSLAIYGLFDFKGEALLFELLWFIVFAKIFDLGAKNEKNNCFSNNN